MPYKADRRLYLNGDKSRVVEEGDPEAAFLYLAEGQSAPLAEARGYGLVEGEDAEPATEQPVEAEVKAVSKAPSNKAMNQPQETK